MAEDKFGVEMSEQFTNSKTSLAHPHQETLTK